LNASNTCLKKIQRSLQPYDDGPEKFLACHSSPHLHSEIFQTFIYVAEAYSEKNQALVPLFSELTEIV